jgi:LuxR family maltose regulon positive regulatory protein
MRSFLLNELTQQQQDGLLVLDDYHVIEEPAIHETLTFFLDYLPTTLHVLLLARSTPPLPLLRWRARGDISELHAADLRFTPEETAAFARRAFSTPLSDAALSQLDASLQGWAAGLRLLSLSLAGQRTGREVERALISLDEQTGASSPYRPLLDYFVTEILNAQPEVLQHFLLQTSVLNRLNGPLCAIVTGVENSTERLEAIAQAGLFLEGKGWNGRLVSLSRPFCGGAAPRGGPSPGRSGSAGAVTASEPLVRAARAGGGSDRGVSVGERF